MITKINDNEVFSDEFRNAVQKISEIEICFDKDVLSAKISELFNASNVTKAEIDTLEKRLKEYCNSDLTKMLREIKNKIGFEESSGYDRRRIGNGDYHSRSETSYNLAFLKLYKNIIDGIDSALKESEISFEGFSYHFSRHKNSLKVMLPKIRWADNRCEERGKTNLYRSLEKQCFEFLVLLLLFKTLKTKNHD